jgi:hypothetical protein
MLLAQVTTTEEAKRQAEKQHMFQSILEAIRDEVSELKVLSDLTLRKAELLVEGSLVVIVLHLMHEIERIWFKMILLVLRHAGRSHDGIHTWNTFNAALKSISPTVMPRRMTGVETSDETFVEAEVLSNTAGLVFLEN